MLVRKRMLRIMVLAAALLLSSCGEAVLEETPLPEPTAVQPTAVEEQSATEEAAEESAPEEPEYAEEITIGIGRDLYYGAADWHIIHGSLMVWEPLLYPDQNLEPQPYLAESWEPNDDLTEWTFFLKEDITFHDGSTLTAQAAVDNLMGIHENYTPLPTLDRMEVVDDLSFKIILTEPTPALPDLMVFFQSAMLSPGTRDQEGAVEPVPYGTGPYTFVDYVPGEQIILERNEDYWGEPAKTKRVIYRFIPDATTRLQALQSGEIDAIADVGSLIPSQGEIVEADEDLKLKTVDVLTTHYLFFNTDQPPFDDPLLRKAASLAVDRQLIVDETVYGYGVPGSSLITQLAEAWVNPEASPEYDPEQAQVLAENVLGGERVEVSFVVNSGLANRWPYGEIAQIIQFELAELGIDVKIQTVEGGTWNEMLANDEYQISMRPYTMSSGDPDDFMTYWARPDGVFNQKYSISYQNQQIQELVTQAVSETDSTLRKDLYDQIQTMLIEEAPFTPVYHEVTLYAMRENVYDLSLDAVFRPTLDTMYKLVE
jgi:peptide/nickel transport system substrate-binding protein